MNSTDIWRRCCNSRTRSRICFWIVTSSAVVGSSAMSSLRLAGDRHRDHHPLLLAARHLRRIGVDLAQRVGDAHLVQQLDRALARRAPGETAVQLQHLLELVADGEHRVQRRHRLLEDHRDLGAADVAQLPRRQRREVAPAEADLAALVDDRVLRRQESQDRERGDALARARLPDQRDGGVPRDVEGDAAHRVERVVAVEAERDAQVADADQRVRHGRAVHDGVRNHPSVPPIP